ncbi:hypothetical protein OIU34_24495 [Pararhizobium sp. BT-229]|uniref:hypothetical protein n=1 Tax=Pararhizobium sp. BT-229 TaxID=2986923 RepID=UPI0021F6B452|nr:hypothetical protein [Pararhizobium sp. BT-229]MCV9965061.1 hypothetical protein [Pararhizobium sp. BT-229]
MAVHMHQLTDLQERQRREAVRHATLYRPPSFVERLFPSKLDFWRAPDVSTDTVITAHNPVLAIILLKQALAMDLDCVLTGDGGADDWPYDLAMHPHTTMVVASALGVPADRYGKKERFLAGLAEEFIAPSAARVRKLPPGIMLTAHSRQLDGEIALTTKAAAAASVRDAHGEAAWGILGAALVDAPVLKLNKKRRTVVFAPRAVVTGRADGFAPSTSDGTVIAYHNVHIHAVGTAARVAVTNVQKAEMMVDDIVRCSRFEF